MKKKLVLVYPPKLTKSISSDLSLALSYLAGTVKDFCDISIFDFNIPAKEGKSIDDLLNLVRGGNEDTVIGINCLYSALFPNVLKIARAIKRQNNSIKLVVGGMHPTLYAEEIMQNYPDIDAVAVGEGEEAFPNILKHLWGEKLAGSLHSVVVRDADGNPVTFPKEGYIKDLDKLYPAWEFFDFPQYAQDTSKWWDPDGIGISRVQLPLLTSRSCPNHCNFCAMRIVMGDKIRFRTADSVLKEIKYLYDKFSVNYFKIMDDNFTISKKRTIEICKGITDLGIKAYFDTPNGISIKTLDEEVIHWMRKAGFILTSLAVESGSEYIRNEIMGKHVSREEIIRAFRLCAEAGVKTRAFFIIGMPEETEESLAETENLIKEIDTSVIKLHIATPFPGTQLYAQCLEDRLMDSNTFSAGGDAGSNKNDMPYYQMNAGEQLREYIIKPYKLSLERLKYWDLRLQNLAREKSSAWINHIKKSNT